MELLLALACSRVRCPISLALPALCLLALARGVHLSDPAWSCLLSLALGPFYSRLSSALLCSCLLLRARLISPPALAWSCLLWVAPVYRCLLLHILSKQARADKS
eukprot:617847-Amphidinium_carterae.2